MKRLIRAASPTLSSPKPKLWVVAGQPCGTFRRSCRGAENLPPPLLTRTYSRRAQIDIERSPLAVATGCNRCFDRVYSESSCKPATETSFSSGCRDFCIQCYFSPRCYFQRGLALSSSACVVHLSSFEKRPPRPESCGGAGLS